MKFVVFIATIAALAFRASADLSGRIFNGQEAVPGQFKYIVAVLTPSLYSFPKGGDVCGGTIIAPDWILTAAHCLYKKNLAKIYLGSIDRHDAAIKYVVKKNKFFLHPKYMRDQLSNTPYPQYHKNAFWNDIALIKIPNTEECDQIGYAHLAHPGANSHEGGIAFVMGWGQIRDHGIMAERLRWTSVEIITNEMCNKLYGDIIDSDLCVKTTSPYGSHCVGDSGGPLISSDTGEVIGVASAVPKTYKGQPSGCEDGHPAIFARITTHMPWITDVTGVIGNPEPVPAVIDMHEVIGVNL